MRAGTPRRHGSAQVAGSRIRRAGSFVSFVRTGLLGAERVSAEEWCGRGCPSGKSVDRELLEDRVDVPGGMEILLQERQDAPVPDPIQPLVGPDVRLHEVAV